MILYWIINIFIILVINKEQGILTIDISNRLYLHSDMIRYNYKDCK